MTTPSETVAPFSRDRIRVSALVFCGDEVALIRRDRSDGTTHYTTVGGNLEPGESYRDGLERELAEELRLDIAEASVPELCWLQLQMVSRPGPTPPPRKLHVIYRCFVDDEVRSRLATTEEDEQTDGSVEIGVVEWVDYRRLGDGFPLFPLVGAAVAELSSPDAAVGSVELPDITDDNYVWV